MLALADPREGPEGLNGFAGKYRSAISCPHEAREWAKYV